MNIEIIKPYNNKIISLSGVSAVGKSTIVRLLAKKLSLPYYDLDDEIAKEAGFETTAEIIANLGHIQFKIIQNKVLNKLLSTSSGRFVISVGGEVWRPTYDKSLIEGNRKIISQYTYNITLSPSEDLDAMVSVLYPRLNDGKRDTRTKGPDEFKEYVRLGIQPLRDLADAQVFIGSSSPDEIADRIIAEILHE